jgi:hypothetical protein
MCVLIGGLRIVMNIVKTGQNDRSFDWSLKIPLMVFSLVSSSSGYDGDDDDDDDDMHS